MVYLDLFQLDIRIREEERKEYSRCAEGEFCVIGFGV